MIVLGAPVLTADYDLWVHIDDVEKVNAALATLDHVPNATPAEARQRGRYVFENDERVDVIVARSASTQEGERLDFETAWRRKQTIEAAPGVEIHLPSLADLITTKRWGSRPKDLIDIEFLDALRREGRS